MQNAERRAEIAAGYAVAVARLVTCGGCGLLRQPKGTCLRCQKNDHANSQKVESILRRQGYGKRPLTRVQRRKKARAS